MASLTVAHSPKVVFERGALSKIKVEIELLQKKKILLISDESDIAHANKVRTDLGSLVVQSIDQVIMHVPDEFSAPIVESAKKNNIDLVISIGGGSATGLGKIVALDGHIDLMAVPTTYAGSEMTTIWGRTRNNQKITGRDMAVLPKTSIYDPELTYSLPLSISVNSGMNAIAHAVEALYAPDLTSIVKDSALEGIEVFSRGLRTLNKDINNLAARDELLRGSMLCGFSLSNATMGIHHKICHTLGGMFDLPHAPMHSAVLPWAVQYNLDFAQSQLNEIAAVLNSPRADIGVWDLANEVGAQTSLKNIGYPLDRSEEVAHVISQATLVNPRPFEKAAVMDLLESAYKGSRPNDES
ncbi:MAG: maleylacetate reductase [Candidatus Nanopelagicaceae bacterium]